MLTTITTGLVVLKCVYFTLLIANEVRKLIN